MDKTGNKKNKDLQKRELLLENLLEVGEKINKGLTLRQVLDEFYESLRGLIPYDRIGVSLIDEKEGAVNAYWFRSRSKKIMIGNDYSAPLNGSSLERIIKTKKPRIINDLKAYLKKKKRSRSTDLIVKEGMLSSLTCPLTANGKAIGFIFFSSMSKNIYRKEHISTFSKISSQLSLVMEKSRIYEKLVELNEVKNKFLGMAAHDLRSPLTVIKGFLDLLETKKVHDSPEIWHEVIREMEKTSERMLNLINELLDISVIESGTLNLEPEKVNVSDYVHETVNCFQKIADSKDIAIKMRVPKKKITAFFDRERIDQVMGNLITNAIKYSYPGSEIRVVVKGEKKQLVFSVIDQGKGIPKKEIPSLFKDFGRTSVKPTSGEKSIGLGLAIAKRIVLAHKGRVFVTSTSGKGSKFSFTIPDKTKKDI